MRHRFLPHAMRADDIASQEPMPHPDHVPPDSACRTRAQRREELRQVVEDIKVRLALRRLRYDPETRVVHPVASACRG